MSSAGRSSPSLKRVWVCKSIIAELSFPDRLPPQTVSVGLDDFDSYQGAFRIDPSPEINDVTGAGPSFVFLRVRFARTLHQDFNFLLFESFIALPGDLFLQSLQFFKPA